MEKILSGNEFDVIDLIRNLRNDLIKDCLDERNLKTYIADKFNIKELSTIKIEFIKKDLKELLLAPVDTEHYKPLMDEIIMNERTSLAEGNELLFYKELDRIFVQHIF
jgi:hypothetical protein